MLNISETARNRELQWDTLLWCQNATVGNLTSDWTRSPNFQLAF